jgi:hypothetical protein
LIYIDGSYTGSKGRYHRISRDGGATWSDSKHIIPELVGVNGYVMPIVDGAGQLHLIANMRTEAEQVVGIYYARWQGTSWSPVTPIDVSLPEIHYTAAAVRLGNELHIVYNQLQGAEVWHIHGLVPQVSPQPALTLPVSLPSTESVQVTEMTTSTIIFPVETTALPFPGGVSPHPMESGAIHPLLPAIALTFLVVVGVIVWTRINSPRPKPGLRQKRDKYI